MLNIILTRIIVRDGKPAILCPSFRCEGGIVRVLYCDVTDAFKTKIERFKVQSLHFFFTPLEAGNFQRVLKLQNFHLLPSPKRLRFTTTVFFHTEEVLYTRLKRLCFFFKPFLVLFDISFYINPIRYDLPLRR